MIKIICVGKIKEKYLKDAIEEYKKRISKYTKLDIIEVSDVGYKEIDKVKKLEGESIFRHLKRTDNVIVLDVKGEEISSIMLADKLRSLENYNSNLTFVIGGSYGLDEEIIKRANYVLSFSKLTFPHQLFRVMFLEQLYRSYKIRNNEDYHK